MRRIGERVHQGLPGGRVSFNTLSEENCVNKLFVAADGVQIKIEVTPVLRGCVHAPVARAVSPKVEEQFGFAEIQIVSFPDLYAGKIVAALDRQHPRDLFDVRDLLANEGIDDELRKTFLVYILSHNRPMAELLACTRLDISQEFARGFEGLTEKAVTLDELLRAREDLIADIVGNMPADHRRFLTSFKRGEPEWALLDMPGVEQLPAVQWKLQNLARLDKSKREALVTRLRTVLDMN